MTVTSSPSTLANRSDVTATSGWSSAKSPTSASTSTSERSTGVVGAGLLALLALMRGQSLRVDPEQWPRLALAAALLQLGHYVFVRIGASDYYGEAGAALRVDRTAEVLFFFALGACGLLAGQVVRQARRLVEGYPVTVVEPDEERKGAAP